MRRRILMVLFALGAIGGYASGFCHMGACARDRRAAWEAHVARVCVDAARGEAGRPADVPRGPGF
jgi:hypothetical protein